MVQTEVTLTRCMACGVCLQDLILRLLQFFNQIPGHQGCAAPCPSVASSSVPATSTRRRPACRSTSLPFFPENDPTIEKLTRRALLGMQAGQHQV